MNEKKIVNYPEYINIQGTETILEQMKKCICKIYEGKSCGTGFFCIIPYQNKNLKVLITNYHVINENYIKEHSKIKLGINDDEFYMDIFLENNRKIYLSDDNNDDLAIIEIKDKDYLNKKIKFLELDKSLFIQGSESIYTSEKSIYIIQYPNSKKASVSYAILSHINDNQIKHKCSTEYGSSGSPILNLKTNQVIGVHKGHDNHNYNLGTFLKGHIIKLNNGMKTIGEIKNNHFNNNEKEYNNYYNHHNFINNNLFYNKNKFIPNYNFINNVENINNNHYKINDNNIIELLQKMNISKEELEQNLNGKIFENKENIHNREKNNLMNKNGNGKGELNQNQLQITYFQIPSYNGNSIVDALKSIGEESSFDYRARIAVVNGIVNEIQDYNRENNEEENIKMLNLLKQGQLKKP